MSTATIADVELVRVGTHAASTGVTKITAEDLDAMVAAYGDRVVDRPVIKIGHESALNDGIDLGDGEPAYGWLENITRGTGSALRPDPNSLYGDYTGMPAKLAEIAPAAYRRRSVEIAWGVTTSQGKEYPAVLTGIALLGVAKPAVKGLADVLALYSALDTAERITTLELVTGLDAAQVSTLSAARAELIALAEGHALPATALAEALVRLDALSGVRDTSPVPPALVAPADADTNQTTKPEEGTRMTINKADVDKALEKAGDEDVTALLEGLLKPTADVAPVTPIVAAAPVEPVIETIAAKTAATAAPEVVSISKSVFAELTEAAEVVKVDRRAKVISSALSEGKITPAEKAEWEKALVDNEAGTTSLLSAMQPRFTVAATGSDLAATGGETKLSDSEKAAWDEFDSSIGLLG